jgi:hypothetical protein
VSLAGSWLIVVTLLALHLPKFFAFGARHLPAAIGIVVIVVIADQVSPRVIVFNFIIVVPGRATGGA